MVEEMLLHSCSIMVLKLEPHVDRLFTIHRLEGLEGTISFLGIITYWMENLCIE
jgi:hypothetical protein